MKHEDETQQRRQRRNCSSTWQNLPQTCWAKTKIFEKKTCLRKNQFLQVIYIYLWFCSTWLSSAGTALATVCLKLPIKRFSILVNVLLSFTGEMLIWHIFWMSNFDLSYCHLNVLAGYVPQMHEWGVREDWRVHSFYANPVCSRRPCAMPGCLAACEDQT